MVFAGNEATPLIHSLIDFSDISIDVVFNDFIYDLADIDYNASFYHPDDLNNGDSWVFEVEVPLTPLIGVLHMVKRYQNLGTLW